MRWGGSRSPGLSVPSAMSAAIVSANFRYSDFDIQCTEFNIYCTEINVLIVPSLTPVHSVFIARLYRDYPASTANMHAPRFDEIHAAPNCPRSIHGDAICLSPLR
ncbi:hypothetical protein BCEN4_210041 [Burkholderia cenocepacia]|nr:hypothetical protein BCEN4_210041 [Burkholderia cenocepacia]